MRDRLRLEPPTPAPGPVSEPPPGGTNDRCRACDLTFAGPPGRAQAENWASANPPAARARRPFYGSSLRTVSPGWRSSRARRRGRWSGPTQGAAARRPSAEEFDAEHWDRGRRRKRREEKLAAGTRTVAGGARFTLEPPAPPEDSRAANPAGRLASAMSRSTIELVTRRAPSASRSSPAAHPPPPRGARFMIVTCRVAGRPAIGARRASGAHAPVVAEEALAGGRGRPSSISSRCSDRGAPPRISSSRPASAGGPRGNHSRAASATRRVGGRSRRPILTISANAIAGGRLTGAGGNGPQQPHPAGRAGPRAYLVAVGGRRRSVRTIAVDARKRIGSGSQPAAAVADPWHPRPGFRVAAGARGRGEGVRPGDVRRRHAVYRCVTAGGSRRTRSRGLEADASCSQSGRGEPRGGPPQWLR